MLHHITWLLFKIQAKWLRWVRAQHEKVPTSSACKLQAGALWKLIKKIPLWCQMLGGKKMANLRWKIACWLFPRNVKKQLRKTVWVYVLWAGVKGILFRSALPWSPIQFFSEGHRDVPGPGKRYFCQKGLHPHSDVWMSTAFRHKSDDL